MTNANGTIGTTQIANNAVTQAKLSPVAPPTAGQLLGTDGTSLRWQNASNSGGTVTSITAGNGLTGGTINTTGTIALDPTSAALTNAFHRQGGNAFAVPAVVGTTDDNAIELRSNGMRVMSLQSVAGPTDTSTVNVLGGSPLNAIAAGVVGATIAGGGGIYHSGGGSLRFP